jgi:hypothetical protein
MASNVAGKATRAAAVAAGVVVGTVQAVMPDDVRRTKTSGNGGRSSGR